LNPRSEEKEAKRLLQICRGDRVGLGAKIPMGKSFLLSGTNGFAESNFALPWCRRKSKVNHKGHEGTRRKCGKDRGPDEP
jgi:hypothetical protein